MDTDGTLMKVWYLRHLDLFRSLTDADVDEIGGLLDDHYIPAGAELLHDRRRERLYLVKTGAVAIYTNPYRVTLGLLGPGRLFGLSSTFGDASPMIGATTLEPSSICFTTWSKLQHDVFVQRPDVMLRMIQALMELAFAAETGVAGGISTRQRLAKLLIEVCADFSDAGESGRRVRFRLGHADLASMINVARETVGRLLTEFTHAGIVGRDRGCLIIRDVERLVLLAEGEATDHPQAVRLSQRSSA